MSRDTAPLVALEFAPGTLAHRVLAYLRTQPGPIYLVGGSVRDLLLSRPTHDLDLAVAHGAGRLTRRLANALGGAFYMMDAERDTARAVFSDGREGVLNVDCAAWRGATLAEDLHKRDYTINALALDIDHSPARLVDVTGGLSDLDQRLLRLTSPQALLDDPLRGLRAVRMLAELAPWRFRLEDDTARQIREQAGLLACSAAERVRDELVRLLAAPSPAQWLALMVELGQMAVVLPEAEALRGVLQPPPHRADVFDHTLRVVGQVAWIEDWLAGRTSPDTWPEQALAAALAGFRKPLQEHFACFDGGQRSRGQMLRWAALCHDWGKPATRQPHAQADGTVRVRFIGHERVGARLTQAALRRLRFSKAEIQRLSTIVAHHMRPLLLAVSGSPISARAVYRYYRAVGDAGVDIAVLSLADHWASLGPALLESDWQAHLAVASRLLNDFFSHHQQAVAPPPLIDGHELMAALDLSPGRQIGQLLAAIAEAQAVGEVRSRAEALAYAARLLHAS